MPDWADYSASQLLEQYAIMKGDRLVVLHGDLERAIALKLRVANIAGRIAAEELAEAGVKAAFGVSS